MDALPLVLNRHQLELMHQQIDHAIATLHNQQRTFGSNDDPQKDQNLEVYGTDSYQEAQTLTQAIADELQSHLEGWSEASETAKPVALALDSYQLKLLRTSLEPEQNQTNGDGQAIKDILEQLPEESPQEDTD